MDIATSNGLSPDNHVKTDMQVNPQQAEKINGNEVYSISF